MKLTKTETGFVLNVGAEDLGRIQTALAVFRSYEGAAEQDRYTALFEELSRQWRAITEKSET